MNQGNRFENPLSFLKWPPPPTRNSFSLNFASIKFREFRNLILAKLSENKVVNGPIEPALLTL